MSGQLPAWLAERLGVAANADADGAIWQLHTDWHLAPWLTVLLVIAVGAPIVWLYIRESSGAGRLYRGLLISLRLVAMAIVLVMVAQWAIAWRFTGPPAIAVVIDRSASMGIADVDRQHENDSQLRERLVAHGLSEPTRLNLAKLLLTGDDERLLRELANRYRVDVYSAGASVEHLAKSQEAVELSRVVRGLSADGPDSDASRLGDAVQRVLDDFHDVSPAAIVVLTDGIATAGVPIADAARDAHVKAVPLFTIGLGSDQPPRDIAVADVLVDDAVFVNDLLRFEAQVKASGLEGETARVTLRREGQTEPVVTESVMLPAAGEAVTIYLIHRPSETGQHAYVVEVAPHGDELNTENNRRRRIVDVRDERIRVLLAGGYPNYEFRFLKTLLERDSTIELATYLQDADPEFAEQDKTALRSFPISRDELFEYDVLVVSDVNPQLVPPSVWQNIRKFVVEKGGGVAFIAGPRYLPWLYQDNPDVTALLPIDLSAVSTTPRHDSSRGFAVRPTPLGLQSPMMQLGETRTETEQIWRNLGPLYWLCEVTDLKPAAQVLAQSLSHKPQAEIPLIAFHYVGPGRVLFHAVDSTWRWRLGAGDVYFARYWLQSIRFLARGKLARDGVELTTDRREYRRGEPVALRARFRDPAVRPPGDQVTVLLDASGQRRRRIALRRNPAVEGVFDATIADLPDGSFEAVLAEPQLTAPPSAARFTVIAPPGEFARLEMDAATLAAAAEATRGKFYTFDTAGELLQDLPAGRRVPVEYLPPIPLWNRWWLLAAFLVAITSEWILRKRKGML